MTYRWQRTLRTICSERFLAIANEQEVAAVDLHYLPNGTVTGTVILLTTQPWDEQSISKLLSSLDDDLLPDVDVETNTLTYTVVRGEVLGNFEAIAR